MTPVVRTQGSQRVHEFRSCYSLYCRCGPRPSAPEQPRAYAYLRKSLLTIESEVNRTKERLTEHARDVDVELAAFFVEEFGASAAAFERLLQAAIRDKVAVILLPSLLHFAVLGSPNIREYFEDLTHARVLTLPPR